MNLRFMTTKSRLFGTILLILCFGEIWAQPQVAQNNELLDKIIASVDGQIILQSELDREYQYYEAQGGPKVANLKCKILEGLLINKMLLAKAEIEGETASKEEINRAFTYRMQHFINQAGSEERLEQYSGKPIESFKAELRKFLKEQLTIDKMRNKITDDMIITPAEVKKYFQEFSTNELPYYATVVEVRQIVRYPKIGQHDKTAILERLQALKARIQAGEDFAQLAKQYSEDAGSATGGGEVGFWRIGELAPAYEAAALALQPNELSEPIETQFGFHLIQLIDRQKDRYNSRHILLKATISKSAIQEAQVELDSIRTVILEKKLSFEKAAIEYSEDKDTAYQGGLLTNGSQEVKVSIEALPSDIFFIVEKLQPGEISAVNEFATTAGKQAIRIVYLKERIPAHQANLQQDYDKIYQMALNTKKELALSKWFKEVKDETTLNIDPAYQGCDILK
jgi:peptidyl-prolyl cis-trans isomerase SurA